MALDCVVYSANKDCLGILATMSQFRKLACISHFKELVELPQVLIVEGIVINDAIAKFLKTVEIPTKLFITQRLDFNTVKNIDSLFDDVFIGDKSDGLIKYFANILRGYYG